MMLTRTLLISLTILLLAGVGGYALYQGVADRAQTSASACETYENRENRRILPMGAALPPLTLNTLEGQTFTLSEALRTPRVKMALIELFATWCPHCKASVPTLRALQQSYGDRMLVLAVNAGDAAEEASTAIAFRDQYGVTYPILDRPSKDLIKGLCVSSFPTFYLVDKSGRIVWRHIGELEASRRQALEKAIATVSRTP
ncbi:MAG: TlpA family protein disulfide reductase [Vampirovibrionales bacterium]|nr:TlpA family protein disulfide reductase [Vampirovibrionales bacterium]